MARARIERELHFCVKNETALLGRVASALAAHDVSIVHLSVYSAGENGYLQMIVQNNEKAKKALAHFIPHIEERDVVVVEFENKKGTLAPVAKILGNHSVFIDYAYGSSSDGFKIVGIFSTSDNAKAVRVINEESGTLGIA